MIIGGLGMFKKNLFLVFAAAIFSISLAPKASAQLAPLRGTVLIQQADGQKVPAADAQIDVFRTDITGKYSAKTNKKGEFVFAGLPYTGMYIIAASHPSGDPWALGPLKLGQRKEDNYELVLPAGSGHRYTESEAKAAVANTNAPGAPKETAADRAKREEMLRRNKEEADRAVSVTKSNEVIERSFKAGNEAYGLRKFDEAIRLYDEGLAADTEHPRPNLLTNKALALKARAADRYNSAFKAATDAEKQAGREAALKDWRESVEAVNKALQLLKAEATPTDATDAQNLVNSKYIALSARADAMRLFVTKVDQTKADEGEAAFQEYIAVETDPVKKSKAEHSMAQMLFDAGALDKARAAYEKILATTPDDVDSLVAMGMILFSAGSIKEGEGKAAEAKATYQQAANYLQQFIDKAPDTHPLKNDAKEVIENLKNQQNVKAEKTAPVRRPRRP
jgi:tetratricopeptide (TPR) repeat protein